MKIVFLGSQGSGKSTQAKMLAAKLNLPYLEMGQLLRDRSQKKDSLAKQLKNTLDSGQLVRNQVTIKILNESLAHINSQKGYVLDGFPRNKVQYQALESDIDLVIYIKISDNEAKARLTKRLRSDDTVEAVAKRLALYYRETEPLILKFRERGILKEINGQRPIGKIHQDISKIASAYVH